MVDTGIGGRGGRGGGMPMGRLMGELEKVKVSPDQISRVLTTHMHADHIGWNTIDRDGKPDLVFKNARHIVQRKEWEYYTRPDAVKDNPIIGLCVLPVMEAGLMDLIDGEQTISAGISSLFTPGHTPGHQSFLISSGGEKAIIAGDVTHTPAQVAHPDWSPEFDFDPKLSAQTRASVFDRIDQEGLRVCAGHYPYPSIGAIIRVEGKRRWQWL
jgi:glyoxylase-like metal-dependent hydrolase (beta-lactamase superfamily II)